MINAILRVFGSPYLLILIILIGCAIGGLVLTTAYMRTSNATGIDAARIQQMRTERALH